MITQGRVSLSPFVRGLRQKLFDWMSNPDLRRAAGEFATMSEFEFDAWLQRQAAAAGNLLCIVGHRETATPIGFATLSGMERIHRRARLGIAIGEAAYRSQGLGKEATAALVAHGFRDLGLHRIALDVVDGNTAAIKTYQRCGFQIEGRLREHYFVDGVHRDAIIMGLLRQDAAAPSLSPL